MAKKKRKDLISGYVTKGGRYVSYYGASLSKHSVYISTKYATPLRTLGKGAWSNVLATTNAETNEEVAIRIIDSPFYDAIEAKRILREIVFLAWMDHQNVISIKDILRPPDDRDLDNVFIVYDLMDTDLCKIISSRRQISDDDCQYIIYQLLCGLKYIHSANVIHRHLKPSNLLLSAKFDLKICDFGLARLAMETEYEAEYVVTRWYRPPELLLYSSGYTTAIDIWSVGCILGEILTSEALFPGKDHIHQLKLITELIGSPDDASLWFLQNDGVTQKYIKKLPRFPKQQFSARFPKMSTLAVDLLEKMLIFDPKKRITVDEALCHPYLSSFHDVMDEPVCPSPVNYDFKDPSLTIENIKELIWEEIRGFNPDPVEETSMQELADVVQDTEENETGNCMIDGAGFDGDFLHGDVGQNDDITTGGEYGEELIAMDTGGESSGNLMDNHLIQNIRTTETVTLNVSEDPNFKVNPLDGGAIWLKSVDDGSVIWMDPEVLFADLSEAHRSRLMPLFDSRPSTFRRLSELSDLFRVMALKSLSKVLQDMLSTSLADLTETKLSSLEHSIEDLGRCELDVGWLKVRLRSMYSSLEVGLSKARFAEIEARLAEAELEATEAEKKLNEVMQRLSELRDEKVAMAMVLKSHEHAIVPSFDPTGTLAQGLL